MLTPEAKIELTSILGDLYMRGRKNADLPITSISVESEIESISKLFNDQLKKLTFSDEKLLEIICKTNCSNPNCSRFNDCLNSPKVNIKDCTALELSQNIYNEIIPYLSQLKEQAKTEERKAIGAYIDIQNWNPDYHGAYILPKVVIDAMIKKLKQGQSLNNQEKQ